MIDDIVTQLVMFSLDDGTDALNKLLVEAVNEIERLRASVLNTFDNGFDEIERLRAELQMAVKWRDNYKLAFERCQGKETPNE